MPRQNPKKTAIFEAITIAALAIGAAADLIILGQARGLILAVIITCFILMGYFHPCPKIKIHGYKIFLCDSNGIKLPGLFIELEIGRRKVGKRGFVHIKAAEAKTLGVRYPVYVFSQENDCLAETIIEHKNNQPVVCIKLN